MRGDPYAERSQPRPDWGKGVGVFVPPGNAVDRMRRERNEIAADAVEKDALPLQKRCDLIERRQVLDDELAESLVGDRCVAGRFGSW